MLQAAAKFGKDTAGGEAPPCPEVCIPDPSSRCIPPLPPPVNVAPGEAPPLPAAALPAAPQGAGAQAAAAEKAEELVEAEEAEADAAAGGGDAVVTVGSGEGGLKLEEGCALGGGWGTSNIGRPTSLSGGLLGLHPTAAGSAPRQHCSALVVPWHAHVPCLPPAAQPTLSPCLPPCMPAPPAAVDLVAARMEEHRARSGLFVAWDALPEEEDGYGEALPPGLPVPSGYEPDSLQDEAVPADGDADAAEEVQRW